MSTFDDSAWRGSGAPSQFPATRPVEPSVFGATVAPDAPRRAAIRFTASGSEYFRIWIVNLLLTLVTLSIYYPFARARKLRYFHANTLVDEQPLGFHGDPWKMLRGHLLVVLFLVCYGGAGRISPVAGGVAALIFAALWPALWVASLRFRLGNTSWRGLRLHFSGSLPGAYLAFAPFLPALLVVLAGALVGDHPEPETAKTLGIAMGLMLLLMLALMPLGLAQLKRYQHGHFNLGAERTQLSARTRSFYAFYLRSFGLTIITMVMVFATVAGVSLLVGAVALASGASKETLLALLPIAVMLAYLPFFFVLQPYAVSRLQNLVWNHTASQHVGFESRLRASSLAWRMLKNFFFMVITLGLYRPFAVVHTTRLRLESTQVLVQGDVNQWLDTRSATQAEAAGDAAGDVLGIDIGL